ncbi:hypothetical protein SD71_20195 [Cohnella kolymensis]|uniref:Inhibitor I9 domain-containing protein n=1 Tax=Cohnella kolymensis TaxID=1590652 RepID=A0ABR5A037_9BACL|nr:hypothetical protein [Cohnella kolymensis]KIL34355.1 hypothetical protein SD71_20195 [Cohnella kolymensis]
MNDRTWRWLTILLAAVILGGCGASPDKQGAELESKPHLDSRRPSQPGEMRSYLAAKNIPNGDIYLQDGLLYVNVVALNERIEAEIAELFVPGSYKLMNVKYTIQQLEAAQQLLLDQNLHEELNIYSSGIDVIGNKI